MWTFWPHLLSIQPLFKFFEIIQIEKRPMSITFIKFRATTTLGGAKPPFQIFHFQIIITDVASLSRLYLYFLLYALAEFVV